MTPREPLHARSLAGAFLSRACTPENVCGISQGFPWLSPMHGQVAHVLRTRSPLNPPPKGRTPYDLHVLSAPPAFVLSQDQTLHRVQTALLEQTLLRLFGIRVDSFP